MKTHLTNGGAKLLLSPLFLILILIDLRASEICVFDPGSPTVPNRVVSYLSSQDTAVWTGNPNCVINPVMPPGIALSLLKVTGGNTVVEMSQAEKDSLAAAAVTAANAAAVAYLAETKAQGKALFDDNSEQGRLFRALCETLLDEVNIPRATVIGTGALVYDPASMANATGLTSSNVTVTGASFGDFVEVAAPYTQAGIIAEGYVVSANTVAIRLHNGTGAAVNLASGTWNVAVRRFTAVPAKTPAQARTALQSKIDAQP